MLWSWVPGLARVGLQRRVGQSTASLPRWTVDAESGGGQGWLRGRRGGFSPELGPRGSLETQQQVGQDGGWSVEKQPPYQDGCL